MFLTFRIFMLSRAGDPGTPIPGREAGRPWEALGRPGAPIQGRKLRKFKSQRSQNSQNWPRAPRESLGGLGRPQDPSFRTKTHWQAPSGLDLQRVQDGELWPENAGRVEGDLYRVSIG